MRKQRDLEKLALERIKILFKLAKEEYKRGRKDLANRYVYIARKIAMKVNLRMPLEYKRQFCKNCGAFWVVGDNVVKRIKKKVIEYTCKECGKKKRIPISPKKSKELKK